MLTGMRRKTNYEVKSGRERKQASTDCCDPTWRIIYDVGECSTGCYSRNGLGAAMECVEKSATLRVISERLMDSKLKPKPQISKFLYLFGGGFGSGTRGDTAGDSLTHGSRDGAGRGGGGGGGGFFSSLIAHP